MPDYTVILEFAGTRALDRGGVDASCWDISSTAAGEVWVA